MTDQTATDQTAGLVGAWRVSYIPGSWLVLTGPTSVVVLQPAAPQWSELVASIWDDVLAARSVADLGARMSGFGLDEMPSYGAFFWTDSGLRSQARGALRVIEHRTGAVITHGSQPLDWATGPYADSRQIRVEMEPPPDQPLVLPTVVGVVSAASLLLDATAPVRSVQVAPATEESRPAAVSAPPYEGAAPVVSEPAETQQFDAAAIFAEGDRQDGPAPDEDDEDTADDLPVVPAVSPVSTEELDGHTMFASSLPGAPRPGTLPPQPAPAPAARPVLGVLRVSTGEQASIDRPVLVGRSPSASRVTGSQLPRLLTVTSPSHDISRTHLEVAPKDGQLVVTDLHSTNGTILLRPGAAPTDLRAGEPVVVGPGCRLDLGDGVMITIDADDQH